MDFFSALDTSRPRQTVDIQYNIIIMGGREVSRPYRVWFFAKRLFFMFLFQFPSIFPLNWDYAVL